MRPELAVARLYFKLKDDSRFFSDGQWGELWGLLQALNAERTKPKPKPVKQPPPPEPEPVYGYINYNNNCISRAEMHSHGLTDKDMLRRGWQPNDEDTHYNGKPNLPYDHYLNDGVMRDL